MNANKLITLILPLGLILAGCNGGSTTTPTGDTGSNPPSTEVPGGETPGGEVPGETPGGNDNPDGETPPDSSDKQAPAVVATIPADNTEAVAGDMLVEFNEPISAASVSTASVSVQGPNGAVDVEVAVAGNRITFIPNDLLVAGNAYTVTVGADVTDLAGNALGKPYSWHFTVAKDVCSGFYNGGFTLKDGKDLSLPLAGFAKPAKGKRYADPAYGSCVVRATDHEAEGLPGFARNDYSRRQPFNADDSNFLIYAQDGNWHLYRTSDLAHVRKLVLGGGSVEPQWHPTNPDILYMFPNNGGMTISTYNVRTDEKKIVADFRNVKSIAGHPGATSLTSVWPMAARVWTKSEGSPSADARYWGLQVETSDFKPIGMITYDLVTNTITGTFHFANDGGSIGRPDHISMSASGDFVVPSWNATGVNCPSRSQLGTRDNPCGLMAYSRDFSSAQGLTVRGPHSDVGFDANGRDIIVAGDYDSGWVEMWDLATGQATKLWQIYENGNSTAMHLSTKNFDKPGWVLISTYAEKAPGWYVNKIMAVELKANPRILNIAHSYNEVETYFSETHAAVNRDFTRILYNSNWNTANVLNIDAYMITLPSDAIPATN